MEKELENNEIPNGRGYSQPPLTSRPKSTVMVYIIFLENIIHKKILLFSHVSFISRELWYKKTKRGKYGKKLKESKHRNELLNAEEYNFPFS